MDIAILCILQKKNKSNNVKLKKGGVIQQKGG